MALPSLEGCAGTVVHVCGVTKSMSAQERLTANINELLAFTRRKQNALAAHLGISQPHASMLLNGKRQWQIEDLDRIAAFFCVTVPDLFHEGHGSFERRAGRERRSGVDRRDRMRTVSRPARQTDTDVERTG